MSTAGRELVGNGQGYRMIDDRWECDDHICHALLVLYKQGEISFDKLGEEVDLFLLNTLMKCTVWHGFTGRGSGPRLGLRKIEA